MPLTAFKPTSERNIHRPRSYSSLIITPSLISWFLAFRVSSPGNPRGCPSMKGIPISLFSLLRTKLYQIHPENIKGIAPSVGHDPRLNQSAQGSSLSSQVSTSYPNSVIHAGLHMPYCILEPSNKNVLHALRNYMMIFLDALMSRLIHPHLTDRGSLNPSLPRKSSPQTSRRC